MSATLRAFVAVELPEAVRRKIVELERLLSKTDAEVKWVAVESLHITLNFLGDVELRATADIGKALEAACSRMVPFTLVLAGAGAFGPPAKPRTLWLGATEGAQQMVQLHAALEHALQPLGFRPEGRRFQPHVTVGRVRRPPRGDSLATLLRQHADFFAGEAEVDEVVLFSSELEPEGPIYTPLARASLAG